MSLDSSMGAYMRIGTYFSENSFGVMLIRGVLNLRMELNRIFTGCA